MRYVETSRELHMNNECPFCGSDEWLSYSRLDAYPVTEGHTLVCTERHVADYRDLSGGEVDHVWWNVGSVMAQLQQADPTITGFNLGVNIGESAGQTIPHVHIHVIPRRDGDCTNPRGGVRGVIPAKQSY